MAWTREWLLDALEKRLVVKWVISPEAFHKMRYIKITWDTLRFDWHRRNLHRSISWDYSRWMRSTDPLTSTLYVPRRRPRFRVNSINSSKKSWSVINSNLNTDRNKSVNLELIWVKITRDYASSRGFNQVEVKMLSKWRW